MSEDLEQEVKRIVTEGMKMNLIIARAHDYDVDYEVSVEKDAKSIVVTLRVFRVIQDPEEYCRSMLEDVEASNEEYNKMVEDCVSDTLDWIHEKVMLKKRIEVEAEDYRIVADSMFMEPKNKNEEKPREWASGGRIVVVVRSLDVDKL
ncbi:MAG: hypothetical protein QXR31_06265, partial [Zestosphaera sp.]